MVDLLYLGMDDHARLEVQAFGALLDASDSSAGQIQPDSEDEFFVVALTASQQVDGVLAERTIQVTKPLVSTKNR